MRAKYTHEPWEREYIEIVNHNGKRKKIGEITRCNDCKYYVVVPCDKGAGVVFAENENREQRNSRSLTIIAVEV